MNSKTTSTVMERIRNEVVVAYFEIFSQRLPEGTEEDNGEP